MIQIQIRLTGQDDIPLSPATSQDTPKSTMNKLTENEYPEKWTQAGYWHRKVSVHFDYAEAGWVSFSLTSEGSSSWTTVDMSACMGSPFHDMLDWLDTVADGKLPAVFYVDEEGHMKKFIAKKCEQNELQDAIEFRVLDAEYGKEENGETCFLLITERKQLLGQWTRKLEDWLLHDYEPSEWDTYGAGEETRRKIQEHPEGLLRMLDIQSLKEKINRL